MQQDSIVEHVRDARKAFTEKFGPDLRSIYQVLKQHEGESERKIVSFQPKPRLVYAPSSFENRLKMQQGSREKFEAVLAKVPDVEPPGYDRL